MSRYLVTPIAPSTAFDWHEWHVEIIAFSDWYQMTAWKPSGDRPEAGRYEVEKLITRELSPAVVARLFMDVLRSHPRPKVATVG